jgi:acetyltransferase-like isoleucine patch superfamily enzyme
MSKIVLYGTGRGAAVAHRFLAADTDHEIVGFTVDAQFVSGETHRGLPLVPFEEVQRRFPPEDHGLFILLGYQGMNGLRAQKFAEARAKGYTLPSYVASDIFRVEPIRVGQNCFILDNQSISLDVTIGDNVVMWSSNHIGDFTRVDDHAWVSSHVTVAANVHIGERAFIGIGATLSNGSHIGREGFVGARVMVAGTVEDGAVHLHGQSEPLAVTSSRFMRMMIAGGKL